MKTIKRVTMYFKLPSIFLISSLFLILFLSFPAHSQVFTTDPVFPVEDQPITITLNGAGTELENTTEDIYAHTGVIITEEAMSTGQWSYVIAPWTSNIPKARLTPLGNNLWELTIDNIRDYYNIPTSVERIYQLAFVFRTASRGAQTRPDIFIDLFTEPVNVRFTQPVTSTLQPVIAEIGTELNIEAVGSSVAGTMGSMMLYAGNELIAQVEDSDTLTTSYEIISQGRIDFRIEAIDGEFKAEDSFYVMVTPLLPMWHYLPVFWMELTITMLMIRKSLFPFLPPIKISFM